MCILLILGCYHNYSHHYLAAESNVQALLTIPSKNILYNIIKDIYILGNEISF